MPPFPKPRLTWAEHGGPFLAAVENGPLSATQFHPEKSADAGIRLLANWIGCAGCHGGVIRRPHHGGPDHRCCDCAAWLHSHRYEDSDE